MSTFLHFLLQNTLAGTAFLAVIFLFRKATGSLSKIYVRILWLLALPVLLLPPLPLGALHTARNLIPDMQLTAPIAKDAQGTDANQAGAGTPEAPPDSKISEPVLPLADTGALHAKNDTSDTGSTPGRTDGLYTAALEESSMLTTVLFALWASGALFFTAASLLQWLRLKKSVAGAVKIQPNVWSSSQVGTPFVMPGLPARIYLPAGLEKNEEQLVDILAHERRHIKNLDPLIRLAALPVLLLHWFNPLVWAALRLMNRDMEMYCDECVLRGADIEQKQHYAQTLLDFACRQRGFLPAVCFGESSTKSRICHILNMKRTRTPVKLLLVLLIPAFGFSFLTAGNAQADDTAASSYAEKPLGDTDGRSEKLLPGGTITYRAADSVKTAGDEPAGTASAADDLQTGEESGSDPLPDEEFWADQRIVGIGHTGMEPGFDLSKETTLLSETAHFALYGKNDGESIVVAAPDGCLIYAGIPYTSTYDVPPVILENDFDKDGENELAVITYVMHGTGVSIYSLFMADHTADSSWKIFQYLDSDYQAELKPHFGTEYGKNGVRLLFDGVPTGVIEDVAQEELDNQYGYYAGSQIAFRFVEEKILLQAGLTGYSKINHVGEFPGHELDAWVRYLGEGKWELEDIRYADANLNILIDEAVPLHLTGETNWVNESYTVPGVVLESPGIIHESVTILSVSYSAETLENNTAEVHVTLRLDNSELLTHLTVPVKRVPLDFGGMWWRISGEITIQ